MKKLFVIAIVAMMSVVASAQPRAIGGRAGYGIEASYQHSVGNNFIEAGLGFNFGTGISATATYNFIFATPEWTPKGTWEWYAGPGLTLGTYFSKIPFTFGIVGQVGLSYTFWFPLQLSVDLRPAIGIDCYNGGARFSTGGLFGFIPTIGVRYCLGR